MSAKSGAFLEQAIAQLAEVVDFAVEYNPITCLGFVHGLVPERGQIEDSQTAMGHSDLARVRPGVADQNGAGIIRAAMSKRSRRSLQQFWSNASVAGGDSEDSA